MTAAPRQPNSIPAYLAKHAEWIYRTLVLGGIIGSMWLTSNYVTREEFKETQKDVAEIKVTLRIMNEQNKVNERQEESLRDHEQRLRDLELIEPLKRPMVPHGQVR